jgi:hypothetical protein
MDDNHDTYKFANFKIVQLFLNALLSTEFFELHLTCEIHIFDRVKHNSLNFKQFCVSQVVDTRKHTLITVEYCMATLLDYVEMH